MAVKILCAGYGKDEKFELEKQVRSIFGPPLSHQEWSISLVKLGGQVSVSVDGPDERVRGKSFLAAPRSLRDSLCDLLTTNGFELPPPEAAFESHAAVSRPHKAAPPPSRPAPAPVARPTAEPHRMFVPAAPLRTPAASPAPAPSRARGGSSSGRFQAGTVPRPATPAPPAKGGKGSASGRHARDTHTCPSCQGTFVVTYEVLPNEPRQLVAVACPHCWKLDRVEVAEGAAIERAYRADKA